MKIGNQQILFLKRRGVHDDIRKFLNPRPTGAGSLEVAREARFHACQRPERSSNEPRIVSQVVSHQVTVGSIPYAGFALELCYAPVWPKKDMHAVCSVGSCA